MFRRLHDVGGPIRFEYDDRTVTGNAGDTVAAAVLAAGLALSRMTAVSGAARAPYCMMGACFDCLVTIDGIGNRQACLVDIKDGMSVESQSGKRDPRR